MAVNKNTVLKTLQKVMDPELNISVVDLGLIYDISVERFQNTSSLVKNKDKKIKARNPALNAQNNKTNKLDSPRGHSSAGVNSFCVKVVMTLTTPACPLGNLIVTQIEEALHKIRGVQDVTVELVFSPAWTPKKMSAKAKKMLGYK